MKVVLDTNVLIAAFITRGPCAELWEHCVFQHSILLSNWIIIEFNSVLQRKFNLPPDCVDSATNLLKENSTILQHPSLVEAVCRDKDDDQILALAISGNADCIVTGDDDLLVLKVFKGIPIIKPNKFWEFELKK